MEQNDFDYRILDEAAHRPWPMPDSPWMMTQTWHDLLFAHWPVDKVSLASKIPAALDLDLFDGEAWIGIVPFHMTNVAPRAVPALPWVSAFPELNVRTYVRVGGKAGVYFFSLDAGNPIAVGVARMMFKLPYFLASMSLDRHNGAIHFTSKRGQAGAEAELVAFYEPTGSRFRGREGTLEYFLTERYCLYTVNADGHAMRVNIHHPPWSLQPAKAAFPINTMAAANGLRLPSIAPVLHFAKRQDVVAWLPEPVRVEATDSA